jgi:UDP-glucose-4-epimerase GalE
MHADGRGQKRSILVTGGAGYIGSHACKYLESIGVLPVAYDDLRTGNRAAVRWGPLVVADIADVATLQETVERYRIEAVLHFAASAYVGESITNPRKYFENNTIKTIRMLNGLLDKGVRSVVFSSTCATYGNPKYMPIDELHPQLPVNPYGDSKLAIERVLRWYGESYGLRWVALRYFNVAGGDPEGEIGELHEEETHLVPLTIRALSPSEPPLRIFGTDYPTVDGTAVRDYVHVTDVAKAHGSALQYLWSGGESRAFNLGTGKGYSVQQIVRTVEQVSGRKVRFAQFPRRPGDPAELIAGADAAQQQLRWCAEHSDIETIVRTAYSWAIRQSAITSVSGQQMESRSQAGSA